MKAKLSDYRNQLIIVKDKITGFQGKVTGHADYITGCDQYLIQPDTKSGEWKEPRWFDENRLDVKSASKSLIKTGTGLNDNGADTQAPTK